MRQWQAGFRVSMVDASASLPPLFGTYVVTEEGLAFRPRFPLRPGHSYLVTLDRTRLAQMAADSSEGSIPDDSTSLGPRRLGRKPMSRINPTRPLARITTTAPLTTNWLSGLCFRFQTTITARNHPRTSPRGSWSFFPVDRCCPRTN
jgi:hypothetical protein